MTVWLVVNWDTIDPGSVVLAVCSSEEAAKALIERKSNEHGGPGVNAFDGVWSRASIEDWKVDDPDA